MMIIGCASCGQAIAQADRASQADAPLMLPQGQPSEHYADSSPKEIPGSRPEVLLSYSKVVKQAAPAVVNIFADREVKSQGVSPLMEDPFFRQFFGDDFFSGASPTRIQRSSAQVLSSVAMG